MIMSDSDKAMAVISILETMEKDNMFLATICMAIDYYNCRTKMPIKDILNYLTTVVPEVNSEMGAVTEPLDAKIISFERKEITND